MKIIAKGLFLLVFVMMTGIGIRAENGYASITLYTGNAEPVCSLYRIEKDGTKNRVQDLQPENGEISLLLEYGEYEIPAAAFRREDGMYETIPMHFRACRETDHITMYLKYEKIIPEPSPDRQVPNTGDSGSKRWIIMLAGCGYLSAGLFWIRKRKAL